MLLKKLTSALGGSGNEGEVRSIVLEEVKDVVDTVKVDRMGNVIVEKKAPNSPYNIVVTAHMDEVGLMVKGIEDSGLIRFAPVGGIDSRILVSKVVLIGERNIPGVIGAKAIHMQKPEERQKALKIDDLYIDIGAKSKDETEKHVSIGDYIHFHSEYMEFGENRVKAKALDNRVGCYVLIDLLKKQLPVNIIGVFTVQEEIGLRGAEVAANQVDANLVVVLEGTTCSDVAEIEPHLQVTELDQGPAISIMDQSSIYNKKYIDTIIDTARKYNIPWQYRKAAFGGNDAGRFHLAKGGTPCVSIAVPCRYIHSPISVLSKKDLEYTKDLVAKYIEEISKGGII
ncbi:M42 family metallopeptidase [Clostridium formicaceticum]|uniref:Aminopeptidase n=1 Tax=Clostridium formicaceticum TaxID=1497 RepID=A0AAC9RIM7_9CLOT|nr:M42 family metallopeptidase [Clostridium formicaceticum]AOY77238.1 aminopeptidase [Clostridium formicaceticum]ARE87771.1 Putative aminopeptidase YsdC [Clostridium formicaceticum]